METLLELIEDYNYRLININNGVVIYEDLEEDDVICEDFDKFINRFIQSLEYEMNLVSDEEEKKYFETKIKDFTVFGVIYDR